MTRLTQIAQHADDLDRAAAFYAVLLGTDAVARFDPPGLLFFDIAGTRLLIDRAAPSALLYFPSSDLHEDLRRLVAAGASVESEPSPVFTHADDTLGPAGTEEWQAFVRDPEGNLVGLVEQRRVTA
ncbi:methylmalonyl-CoA epimerase [Planctomonas sp. JC2975]|uniref:VOC family protein n=1 Tax=Planctomonas sp. JC2975 TaxID=2729626 RepID=UPI001472E777|nr:VOC family protein [Planctomonas sp. JC2975]NNC13496.1 methylmalonyl-CoA epimerase [Planctomonas sp. JC2975]